MRLARIRETCGQAKLMALLKFGKDTFLTKLYTFNPKSIQNITRKESCILEATTRLVSVSSQHLWDPWSKNHNYYTASPLENCYSKNAVRPNRALDTDINRWCSFGQRVVRQKCMNPIVKIDKKRANMKASPAKTMVNPSANETPMKKLRGIENSNMRPRHIRKFLPPEEQDCRIQREERIVQFI